MNNRPHLPRKLTLIVLALSTLMSGCAVSPLVNWTPPPKPSDGSVSMPYAMNYADAARVAYRKRMHEHVEQQGQLSAALLGMGALATGAAAARMHRDVYAGLAFAGGTSYAYGLQNLRPDRLNVYMVGIEAINCAIAVVTPLNLDATKAKALQKETADLNTALSGQSGAMARLRVAVAALAAGPQVDAWKEQLNASATLQTTARATANASIEVDGKTSQAAGALIVAVDRVQTQVEKAGLGTLPSLDSVFLSISNLPRFAGLVLPGAKLDERIGNAVGSTANAANKAQASVKNVKLTPEASAANTAHEDLVTANGVLAAAAARVNGLLAGLDASTNTAGLAECKVAGIVAPLTASKPELRFAGSKDEMQSFTVKGGVSPYRGVLTSSATGVTVSKAPDNDRRFEVRVAAAVTSGSFEVQVTDSANGDTSSVDVAIQVGAAPAPAPAAAPAPAPAAAPTLDSFAKAIGAVKPFKATAGHSYSFFQNVPAGDVLTTQLTCTKAGQAVDTEDKVREALVKAANVEADYKTLFAADSTKFRVASNPATCMKSTP